MRTLIQRRRNDQAGAVLILSTVGVVVAIVCAALAVDVGQIAQEKRNNQKVADLAALDAARDLPAACARAKAAAARNGFAGVLSCSDPTATGMDVEVGVYAGGVFTPSASGTQVRVRASSSVNQTFQPGSRTVTAYGIAGAVPRGAFSIGSSLATVDADRSTLLNRIVGPMIKEPDASLSLALASWQGLAAGNVQLEALRQQLVASGFSAGNVSSMLNSNTMTLNGLFTAMANAMTGSDAATLAAKAALVSLAANVTNTATFTLGDILKVGQGADNMALNSYVNALQMVTAAAELANGSNLIDLDSGITVPGVSSTRLKLQVIEPPKFYYGTVGGYVETAQLSLTVTPHLDLPVNVTGLTTAKVTNLMPLQVTGAGAKATLQAACGVNPNAMVVNVDPKAFSGTTTMNVTVEGTVTALVSTAVTVTVPTQVSVSSDAPAQDVAFSYPSEFAPPVGTGTSKHVGSQPVGLGTTAVTTMTQTGAVTVSPSGLGVSLDATAVANLYADIRTTLAAVDSGVVTRLLTALGMDVGSADVTAVTQQCGTPGLLA